MKKKDILHQILEEKVISIIRMKQEQYTADVIDRLVTGGIKVLEVTSNTPKWTNEISQARKRHPDILIGAGTIINSELARQAIQAGAQFLVTPNTSKEIIEEVVNHEVPVIMGALTPTEIANALSYGADAIKLFPSNELGIPYFKSIKGPFSDNPFFAVGGISMDNLEEWMQAGIDGVGIGSALIKSNISTLKDLEDITINTHQFMEFIKSI